MTIWSRIGSIASPTRVSLVSGPYASAVSKNVIALVVGAADEADAVVGVDRFAVVGAQAHAAQPDR